MSWDLTALLNAADPQAALAERNLWLVRLLEWLRHAPRGDAASGTPLPIVRLKHLLNVLERHPEHASAFAGVIAGVWNDVDAVSLFAEVGFAPRMALWSEFLGRLRRRLLPATTDTRDLAVLFELLFPDEADEAWIAAIDDELLARLSLLFAAAPDDGWRVETRAAITVLISNVHAAGLGGPLRVRMDEALLQDKPFHQLPAAWDAVERAMASADGQDGADGGMAVLPSAMQYLHALLDRCRVVAQTVPEHLEAHGVSVNLMFSVEQLTERLQRIEALLACLLSQQPQRELAHLVAGLVRVVHERRSLHTLFARHYSLLARKVAERSAETGEHYITRSRDEYRDMLARAAGGGAVIAGTTFAKFLIAMVGFTAFWGGFWAGVNYALSFVVIHLLHWTVATKQPAMTAPALAQKLLSVDKDDGLQGFVDEVSHLVRSQVASVIGNLAVVAPLVLAVQGLCWLAFGAPLVGEKDAHYVLHSLSLVGPSLLFAAFTGTLLFASSLVAGWVENWFVFHRLDSAIAWNPRIVATLGRARAQRWSHWWRANISGLAANISLGLMLGLAPALLAFVGLPIEVRHVTLSTGQLAAAVGALGFGVMGSWAFWSCVICIAGIGVLNVGVSFLCAFKVALRSRGVKLADRRRVYAAIRSRLWREPLSFLIPPR